MKVNINEIAYLFTTIGGGWGYNHDLYIVTKDDKIYYTDKFNEEALLGQTEFEVAYRGDLYDEVSNCIVSTSYHTEKNGERKEEVTYLLDLLNENGRVDFETPLSYDSYAFDAPETTLYKNTDNRLEILINRTTLGGDIPAMVYTKVVASQNIRKIRRKLALQ